MMTIEAAVELWRQGRVNGTGNVTHALALLAVSPPYAAIRLGNGSYYHAGCVYQLPVSYLGSRFYWNRPDNRIAAVGPSECGGKICNSCGQRFGVPSVPCTLCWSNSCTHRRLNDEETHEESGDYADEYEGDECLDDAISVEDR